MGTRIRGAGWSKAKMPISEESFAHTRNILNKKIAMKTLSSKLTKKLSLKFYKKVDSSRCTMRRKTLELNIETIKEPVLEAFRGPQRKGFSKFL